MRSSRGIFGGITDSLPPSPLDRKSMAKTVNKSSKNPKKTAAVGDLFASMEKSQRSSGKTSGDRAARVHAPSAGEAGYTAKHIEVLEGLEPVRRRPGMYIGGTDEKALHHLFAEVIDNAMDEALAGHASFIEVHLDAEGFVSVTDNGRGMPVDPHPKFKNKSALEVIMCTLHAGGRACISAAPTRRRCIICLRK